MNDITPIDFLNVTVKVKLAPSPIHGVGVFAIRDIPKQTKLFADRSPHPYRISPGNLGKLFPQVRELLTQRWPGIVQGKGFAYPDFHIQGYMNHSDDPNYDAHLDLSLRDIEAGEEITEDYRQIEGWEEVFPFLSESLTESA